jgi:hypothetical protein
MPSAQLQNICKEMNVYQLAKLASRRPEECREEKLNHFKPPGQGRSLNEQHKVNVTARSLSESHLRDMSPQLYCQQRTVNIVLYLTGWEQLRW